MAFVASMSYLFNSSAWRKAHDMVVFTFLILLPGHTGYLLYLLLRQSQMQLLLRLPHGQSDDTVLVAYGSLISLILSVDH